MLSNHLILRCPFLLLPLSFPVSQLFTSSGQSIGASASAIVLPMSIWGWFPLGLTGLISLQSKGLSRIFSSTTIQKHQFLALSLLYGPTLTSEYDYWINHSFVGTFVGKVMSLLFNTLSRFVRTSLVAQTVKHLPTMRETWVQSLGWEDLLEEEMATHSSILAWEIPWTEEPGGLQSMGLQRVRHDWATSLH